MKIESYRDLRVWDKAMKLVTAVYELTRLFPKDELYSLTNQIRRSSVSVPSNIAEGFGRYSTKEYIQFLLIARGSLFELETQLEVAKNLGYINLNQLNLILQLSTEVGKMINALRSSLIPNP